MAYFVSSQTLQGYDPNDENIQIVKYHFEVDTESDIPTQNQFSAQNVKISMTSTAHVIQNNTNWEMQSDGTWIKQNSNSNIILDAENVIYDNTNSGLSAENVQDAIDEIKSNDDMQDRALAELYAENANQQLEINYAINTGSKNLLNVLDAGDFPRTVNGITYNESNGIITTSGTATISTTLKMPITLTTGTYIISGCPSGGSDSTYRIDMRLRGTSTVVGSKDYGSGFTFTVDTTTDYDCCIRFYNGASAEGLTFKPMIRSSVVSSSTFQSYAPTNRELYELEQQQETEIQEKISISQLFGVKTSLQTGTDLDSLNAGVAACGGASIASTLLHCPTSTSAFIIFTDYVVAESRSIQRLYGFNTISGVPNIFIRSKYSGGWSEWYEVSLQQVATVQSSSASLMQAGLIDAEMTGDVKDNDDEER